MEPGSDQISNALYNFFGLKKNKLIWQGELEDLKALVLTQVDEKTAECTSWRKPRGGTWCFDSDELRVTWYTKRKTINFDGEKAEELCDRINGRLQEAEQSGNVQDIGLNQSIQNFMAEAINSCSDDTSKSSTLLLEVCNILCQNNTKAEIEISEPGKPKILAETDRYRAPHVAAVVTCKGEKLIN